MPSTWIAASAVSACKTIGAGGFGRLGILTISPEKRRQLVMLRAFLMERADL